MTGAGGGSEGDLMRLMGWHDRFMADRHAADKPDRRAFEAKASAATFPVHLQARTHLLVSVRHSYQP
jgi:hypothetical protein